MVWWRGFSTSQGARLEVSGWKVSVTCLEIELNLFNIWKPFKDHFSDEDILNSLTMEDTIW